jgi:hypothetical protein
MRVFFVITIDTEIDRSPDWKVSTNETFFSVLDDIPKELIPLFDQFGAKPTYLLSSEVIENKDCVTVLKNIDNCELGTHLHGDLIEPQRRIYKLYNTFTYEMQNSYPKEIEYQKLKNLTDLFVKKFGYAPTSFRAGRFAAGTNTINSLEKLGYLVDSSVTPCVDWDYPEGEANFLHASSQPYFPSKQDILKTGDSKVLEVPVSIVCSRFRRYLYYSGTTRMFRYLNIIINRISPIYWLRPSFQSSEEMIYVIKKLMKQCQGRETIILNMMFHSMEVTPNASPYTKTEKECDEFLKRIEEVLEYSVKNKFRFVTLSELYPYFRER